MHAVCERDLLVIKAKSHLSVQSGTGSFQEDLKVLGRELDVQQDKICLICQQKKAIKKFGVKSSAFGCKFKIVLTRLATNHLTYK